MADAANIEHYAKDLASEMALSTLFPLSLAQAKALVRAYERTRMQKGEKLSEEELKTLDGLAAVVEKEAAKGLGEAALKEGFFIRLSTRSPKVVLRRCCPLRVAVWCARLIDLAVCCIVTFPVSRRTREFSLRR